MSVCRDELFAGLTLQHPLIHLCLNGLMHGGDQVVEFVLLGLNTLHRTERPFEKLGHSVAEIESLVVGCLKLKMLLRDELLILFHECKEFLADTRTVFFFHELAQVELRKKHLNLKLASV